MNYLKLAWRNIWRNKRRTLITAASLFFAIIFAIIMRSMQFGQYDMMIDNAVGSYSGFIQIQQKDYWNDKSIDDLFEYQSNTFEFLSKTKNIKNINPRIEAFAFASNGTKGKGVLFQAIDPKLENKMSKMASKVVKGRYLNNSDHGILVSSGLASWLSLSIGDSLVLISQGYQGQSATACYEIIGILKFPIPQLDGRLIVSNLKTGQEFFGAERLLSSIAINLHNKKELETTKIRIKDNIDTNNLRVMTWLEINKELKQQIDSDNSSGVIMLLILYTVIFFGVLGTIIMMTAERTKEFGVMVAIGMKRKRLRILIFLESIIMGMIGAVSGALVSFPIVYYYYLNPIPLKGDMKAAMEQYGIEPMMPFSIDPWIFINQFILIVVLLSIASVYPLMKISKFKIINALHS